MTDITCEAQAVSHRYRTTPALDDISFALHSGTVTGLVGANGSGKSTLLRILAGVQRPSLGTVLVGGEDIGLSEGAGRGTGAAVDGMALWPSWTVRRTLLYGARLADVAKVHMEAVLHDLDLYGQMHRRVRTLSLGNRQRVALALAVVTGTRLLLLDEPMNGLDPPARQRTRDLIVTLAREGRTVLLSSHDLQDVEFLTSDLLVLDRGSLSYSGETPRFRASVTMTTLSLHGDVAAAQAMLTSAGILCRREASGAVAIFTHDVASAVDLLGGPSMASVKAERPATLEERFHEAR